MGFVDWYNDKRIRDKLEFEDVPKGTLQRHYDIMCDNVWAALNGSVISDGLPFSRGDHREIKYKVYLFGQSQRRAEKVTARVITGVIDTVLG